MTGYHQLLLANVIKDSRLVYPQSTVGNIYLGSG